MKEKLISFTTAKLAKEMGFDWKVTYHYRDNDIINNGAGYNFNDPEEQALWNLELTSAPTQSLIQRWLCDVHNIVVNIGAIPYETHDKLEYHFDILNKFIWVDIDEQTDKFKTYEEALESGLLCALKLIK